MVDQDCAETRRTRDLCSVLEPRSHFVVHVVAAVGGRGLVCRGSDWETVAAWVVCLWLGTDPLLDFPDQSFRLVWTAAGLAQSCRPAGEWIAICDAGSVPSGATSALRWLALRVLDDAVGDVRAFSLLGCDDGLYPVGDSIRGAGFGSRVWRHVRRLSAKRADA